MSFSRELYNNVQMIIEKTLGQDIENPIGRPELICRVLSEFFSHFHPAPHSRPIFPNLPLPCSRPLFSSPYTQILGQDTLSRKKKEKKTEKNSSVHCTSSFQWALSWLYQIWNVGWDDIQTSFILISQDLSHHWTTPLRCCITKIKM